MIQVVYACRTVGDLNEVFDEFNRRLARAQEGGGAALSESYSVVMHPTHMHGHIITVSVLVAGFVTPERGGRTNEESLPPF
jgi:hypothetical protein